MQKFLQAVFDNGDIERDTYEGLYCVGCEAYYTEDELVDGNCPIHGRPVERVQEENWFFRLSRYQQRLLDWYDEHPEAVIPATRRNEVLGVHPQGLRDISISRSTFHWGVPLPWDPDAGGVGVVRRPPQLHHRRRLRRRRRPVRPLVAGRLHLIGKDIIRFHAVYWPAMLMAAGLEPPRRVAAHGWLLVSGEKMSKTRLNQIAPGELVDEFGVDAVRYHFLRDTPFGPDGDFSCEGMVARYNSDLANNLGNLLSRVATVVVSKCGGIGPAPRPTARWPPAAADDLRGRGRGVGPAGAVGGAGGHLAPDPGDQRPPGGGRAVEVRARPRGRRGDGRRPGGAAHRHRAGLAGQSRRGAEIWRRLGLPGSPADQRLPEAAAWGGYPGGLPVEKGPPLFPRRK